VAKEQSKVEVPASTPKVDIAKLESPLQKHVVSDTQGPEIFIISPSVAREIQLVTQDASITVRGRATDESGVAAVSVNGQVAALDEKGNFSAEVLLKVGENSILVVAMDIHKNTTMKRFTLSRRPDEVLQAKKVAPVQPPAQTQLASLLTGGKYFALVIGIDHYKHLDRLGTAVNDAKEVARVLNEDYGFDVKLLLDQKANRQNISRELNNMRRSLTSKDRLLIYYAGHGDYNRETDTAYWLPVDAESTDTTNWLDAKSITDTLKLTSARHVLIVADSCYSGTLVRKSATDLSGGETREIYLRKMMEKPSRVLISSGGNEPVADTGNRGHSIFADVFIRALKQSERDVFTAEELHINWIKEAVAGRSTQTPEYRIIRASGHDGGDFIFFRKR
jgi:hypothetical protein